MSNSPAEFERHAQIVQQVQSGEAAGMEALYEIVKFHRYRLYHALGQDADDVMHEIYIAVVKAIKRGDVRDPERLIGYVCIVVRNKCADAIKANIYRRNNELATDVSDLSEWLLSDSRTNPEEVAIERQRSRVADVALETLSDSDRRILTDFYLKEKDWPSIATEMGFNSHQFRCHKSRAKAKFGRAGQRVIEMPRRDEQPVADEDFEMPEAA